MLNSNILILGVFVVPFTILYILFREFDYKNSVKLNLTLRIISRILDNSTAYIRNGRHGINPELRDSVI